MQRQCAECGRSFEAKRPSARYCCSSCRGKASHKRKNGAEVVSLPHSDGDSSGITSAVEKQLLAAGKLDTYGGQQALFLAGRLERSVIDSGSAVAALSKELDRMMTALLADVEQEPDALDEAQGKVLHMRTHRRQRRA